MSKKDQIIVGLDIGTTKVCTIVGEVTEDGIDIIGIGTSKSDGLRKGVVVNIDSTVKAINQSIEEAELMAGCEISNVYVSIGGSHIKGINSNGVVAVKDKEVKERDVARVLETASAIALPVEREVIHVLPQEYLIDDQDGIKEPIGMSGVRLQANVHIITAAATSISNIIKCANRSNLEVEDIVLSQLAAADSVLCEDEKELGVVLVDVGGGTTDIIVYINGATCHTAVIPFGGNLLTSDIAIGLRTPIKEAENIKRKYGCAKSALIDSAEEIEVSSVGGRSSKYIPRRLLCEIIEPRVTEIFNLIARELKTCQCEDNIAGGVVITGGSTIMEGMTELAEEMLGLPVRKGLPQGVGGLIDVVKSPMYATGVGLILHGRQKTSNDCKSTSDESMMKGIRSRFGNWFREVFN